METGGREYISCHGSPEDRVPMAGDRGKQLIKGHLSGHRSPDSTSSSLEVHTSGLTHGEHGAESKLFCSEF